MQEVSAIRSYAKANRELADAFDRYLVARGNSPRTIRAYKTAVLNLADWLGSRAIGSLVHSDIRLHLGELYKKGLDPNTLRLRTAALRAFFKFVRNAGLSKYDPTAAISHRKLPRRLQRVLTVEEVERLIEAARNPFERAVVEVLYSTGVRVSELVSLRLEDIDFADGKLGSVRVKRGKGAKDRTVIFGGTAGRAIREYQAWRPSQTGFLFEAPARIGSICKRGGAWSGRLYVGRVQREFSLGSIAEFPSTHDARKKFEAIAANLPGFVPVPRRSYTSRAIVGVIHRLAQRANLGRVHPHMLRRAMACHMLQGGGDLRAIQDLLGHETINTTMLYTWLSAGDLKRVHERCHPRGGGNAKKKA